MTKYKLIKEYPGSPKIGSECTQLENDTITAYPEYWEKVEELCVPVGFKFKLKNTSDFVYTITDVEKGIVTVNLGSSNTKIIIEHVNDEIRKGNWVEYKEPTVYCITEDGYEITSPMENLYWVDDRFNIYTKKASNCKSNVKYYRYRKAAENFIKCTKPVLNYQDVLNLYDENWVRPDRDKFKSQLTKLVKSKLNMNE